MTLPVDGPTSLAWVKVWLSIAADDARDDDRLNLVVDAVNSQVREWRCSAAAAAAATEVAWADRIVSGATMLAARLFRRRNSPGGVESFGSDGAVYVSRTDPDIAQLLGLGTHQPPTVG